MASLEIPRQDPSDEVRRPAPPSPSLWSSGKLGIPEAHSHWAGPRRSGAAPDD